MNDMWWSWILTVVGLTGFVLAGRKVWWCWYINIGCQALWFTYAIVTEQYGFIIASLAYTYVFTQNAIKWTKEHMDPVGEHLKKMNYNEVAYPSNMDYQETYDPRNILNEEDSHGDRDFGVSYPARQSDHRRLEIEPEESAHRGIDPNPFEVEWCGYPQPHLEHYWIKSPMAVHMKCNGRA